MTTVIIPGRAEQPPHPTGKLANALFSIAVASITDPGRLSRGRAYAADQAVQRIEVDHGTLVATVQGGQPNAYQVVVGVATVARPTLVGHDALRKEISNLIPDGTDFTTSCTCADWDAPCKHAVAALVAFSHELIGRPELILDLRCATGAGERPKIGSAAARQGAGRHLHLAASGPGTTSGSGSSPSPRLGQRAERLAPVPPQPSPWLRPEWQSFLGVAPTDEAHIPRERAKVGRAMLGTIDLGAWLGSALDMFTDTD